MKKLYSILILFVAAILASCGSSSLNGSVVVTQIDIIPAPNTYKYKVKLETADGGQDAYYYTNFRHQVGDTLISYYEFFEGKDLEYNNLKRQKDSLERELKFTKIVLDMFKEKLIIDTLKRK